MPGQQILIVESTDFPRDAVTLLQGAGSVTLADLDREGLCASISSADVLWVRLRHRIDERLIERGSRLRVVVSPTTGLDHIDTEALARRGIELLSLRGETEFLRDVRATAEHTIGLMLGLLRHIPQASRDVLSGGWRRDAFKGRELFGKTVGIVGYGRLGRIVAQYLRAFSVRVLVADPKSEPGPIDDGITSVGLGYLLAESDVVSLHVDLRADTRRFFTALHFGQMKAGSCFINTARGELIDEGALLASLKSGRLAGAALDVLCNEDSAGMRDHPVVEYARQHDNVIITPHLGGCTHESLPKAERFLAKRLLQFMAGFADVEAAVTGR
ncbi:MAG: NAD(P)-dependent oxidoreductase [Candidatus Solibacter sp.]